MRPPALTTTTNAAQPNVPVRAVVLFSSGVGYFEHFGTVKGDGTTELRFKTNQINDILKSLILQDLDNGKVTTITYPSLDPISKTLRSFQVDITGNPPLADLLNQLRGAKVTLKFSDQSLTGTILGVEKKQKPIGTDKVIERPALNLLTGASIKSVYIEDVQEITLDDPQLQEELTKALGALAAARDQDKKPVQISFTGQGERRVRLGYVVETPVWKTSYRLILPADAKGDKANLQGWAIVENQTDNDWNNVQLSLVSGRPISFVQDLYQPLYIPRPIVQPELFAQLESAAIRGRGRRQASGIAIRGRENQDRWPRQQRPLRWKVSSAAAPAGGLRKLRTRRRSARCSDRPVRLPSHRSRPLQKLVSCFNTRLGTSTFRARRARCSRSSPTRSRSKKSRSTTCACCQKIRSTARE